MLSINRGRRLLAVMAAASLTLLAAAPAAAQEIHHSNARGLAAEVAWGAVDVETGAGDWGSIVAFEQDGFSGIFLQEQSATIVDCGEYQGLAGTFRFGEAFEPGTIEVAKDLGSASASGTMSVATGSFDECTGTWQVDSEEQLEVSMSLVATGARERSVDRYREAIPNEFRMVQVNRLQTRAAAGTVTLGGTPVAFEVALISKTASMTHLTVH